MKEKINSQKHYLINIEQAKIMSKDIVICRKRCQQQEGDGRTRKHCHMAMHRCQEKDGIYKSILNSSGDVEMSGALLKLMHKMKSIFAPVFIRRVYGMNSSEGRKIEAVV